jgi:Family of unknown function (DUF5677)
MDEFKLNKDIEEKVRELEKLHSNIYLKSVKVIESRDSNNIQHQVLFVCLARIIKYFEAYLILVKKGYGEPSNCILRSIFEGILWMRWSLINNDNAIIYFNSGKTEINNMIKTLMKENLVPDNYNGEAIQKKIAENKLDVKFPSWKKMSQDVGLLNFYLTVYPMLSAMSHGNFIFFGERIEEKEISIEPDNKNILPFLGIADILYTDAFKLVEQFILENKIYPLDQYEIFLKLKAQFVKK